MKFLVAVLIVVAVIGANASYIPKHLTIFGEIDHKDLSNSSKIIGHQVIYQLDENWEQPNEKIVVFPEPGSPTKIQYIQAIAFYDSVSGPSELAIVEGGIGQNHVVLHIRSQLPHKAIDSVIKFYGKKE